MRPNLDEEKLKNLVGRDNPYKVPEGYFEQFADSLMKALPASSARPEPVATRSKWFPYLAAACVCGMVLLAGVVSYTKGVQGDDALSSTSYLFSEDELDTYMTSSLYDEYTLYSYLTSDEL